MAKRLTHADYVERVKQAVGDEYTVKSTYKNAHTKIRIKHEKCGHEWDVSPNSFIRGTRCPMCNTGGQRAMSTDSFKKLVLKIAGSDYKVLGDYVNANTRIKMQHLTCGTVWDVFPNHFVNKSSRCPKCAIEVSASKRRKTHDQFVREVWELEGENYTVLGQYKRDASKIKMRHNECGREYEVVANAFLNGVRCRECVTKERIRKRTKTESFFKWEVKMQTDDEYEVLGSYRNSATRIMMKHKKCGHEWMVIPNVFLSHGTRCPKCGIEKSAKSRRLSFEDFERIVIELIGDEYTILSSKGEYVNTTTKVLMKHNLCGYEWMITPTHFYYHSRRCPKCRYSRGEEAVEEYLNRRGFKYLKEYTFDDLRGDKGGRLRYDFAIINENNDLLCLIEYDGELHYVKGYNGNKLEIRQRYDKLKTQYCIDNNISLIRIPYWELNIIDTILDEDLVELGLLKLETV